MSDQRDVVRHVDTSALRWSEPEPVPSNLYDFDSYVWGMLGGVDELGRQVLPNWTDVALALELEEVALERLTDRLAPWNSVNDQDAYEEIVDDEIDNGLWGMEPGVASAVLALSAAGCWVRAKEVSSDENGTPVDGSVHFFAPVHRIGNASEVLLQLAEQTECGLVNSAALDGGLELYANSPWKMLAFARALHELLANQT